jgi:chemotaxis protein MotB
MFRFISQNSYKMKKNLLIVLAAVAALSACVPARQYDEMQMKKGKCDEENSKLKAENLAFTTKNQEFSATNDDLKKRVDKLEQDTSSMGTAQRRMSNLYNELNNSYEKLLANNDKLLASKNDETKKVIGQLQMTQEELIKKQDELTKKENALNKSNDDLKQREAALAQLQKLLNEKDSISNALRATVSKALTGFEGNGLTVTIKNGNVYVSMEEKLLFASGSTVVDKDGEQALKQLAGVLEKNTDISVRIEGHTDNVPIAGGPIKDNWDLSVLRATSVTKILTKYGNIDPVRLIPSGRGPYLPVDTGSSADSKRKNRRIEVILIPKLDELMQALEKK